MSESVQSSSQKRVLTPLWIIALFISLTETVLGVGVIQTSGGIQIALTAFVLLFPLLIAETFFLTLWKKPWVLYAPMEYGKGTDVKEYVREMSDTHRAKSLEGLQTYPQIQQSIRDALTSPEIIGELIRTASRTEYTSHDAVKNILDDAATKAEENIRKQAFLTIDSRPFGNVNGHVWEIPYDRYNTISELLDDIFLTLVGEGYSSLQANTFGKMWILRDPVSGHIFKDMGRGWAAAHQGTARDLRNLAQVGIHPGMTLETCWK